MSACMNWAPLHSLPLSIEETLFSTDNTSELGLESPICHPLSVRLVMAFVEKRTQDRELKF